jgi:hypothetical protein
MSTLREMIDRVRSVGIDKARIVPSDNGKFVLEIKENNQWIKITKPMQQNMVEDVLRQAADRVILG